MPTFQIRDEDSGIALRKGKTAREALLAFLASRALAEKNPTVTMEGKEAVATMDGKTYRAVP